jgi:hypothetical protein
MTFYRGISWQEFELYKLGEKSCNENWNGAKHIFEDTNEKYIYFFDNHEACYYNWHGDYILKIEIPDNKKDLIEKSLGDYSHPNAQDTLMLEEYRMRTKDFDVSYVKDYVVFLNYSEEVYKKGWAQSSYWDKLETQTVTKDVNENIYGLLNIEEKSPEIKDKISKLELCDFCDLIYENQYINQNIEYFIPDKFIEPYSLSEIARRIPFDSFNSLYNKLSDEEQNNQFLVQHIIEKYSSIEDKTFSEFYSKLDDDHKLEYLYSEDIDSDKLEYIKNNFPSTFDEMDKERYYSNYRYRFFCSKEQYDSIPEEVKTFKYKKSIINDELLSHPDFNKDFVKDVINSGNIKSGNFSRISKYYKNDNEIYQLLFDSLKSNANKNNDSELESMMDNFNPSFFSNKDIEFIEYCFVRDQMSRSGNILKLMAFEDKNNISKDSSPLLQNDFFYLTTDRFNSVHITDSEKQRMIIEKVKPSCLCAYLYENPVNITEDEALTISKKCPPKEMLLAINKFPEEAFQNDEIVSNIVYRCEPQYLPKALERIPDNFHFSYSEVEEIQSKLCLSHDLEEYFSKYNVHHDLCQPLLKEYLISEGCSDKNAETLSNVYDKQYLNNLESNLDILRDKDYPTWQMELVQTAMQANWDKENIQKMLASNNLKEIDDVIDSECKTLNEENNKKDVEFELKVC